jgi:hypothetical protein
MTVAGIGAASASTPPQVRISSTSSASYWYVLLGKKFAYLGFPPLYVGELAVSFNRLSIRLRPRKLRLSRLQLPSGENRMDSHKNGPLTPLGRERLVRMVPTGHSPKVVRQAQGVCLKTVN